MSMKFTFLLNISLVKTIALESQKREGLVLSNYMYICSKSPTFRPGFWKTKINKYLKIIFIYRVNVYVNLS